MRDPYSGLIPVFLTATLSLVPFRLAAAAEITVDGAAVIADAGDGRCSLVEALENANDERDGRPHADCPAGDPAGADQVTLQPGGEYIIGPDNGFFEHVVGFNRFFSALPPITGSVIVNGNGATVRRTNVPGATVPTLRLRLLFVAAGGDLTLNHLTLRGGRIGPFAEFADQYGGGVYNAGVLTLDGCVVGNNQALLEGGGIFTTRDSHLTVTNSVFTGNRSGASGSALSGFAAAVTVSDSKFIDNDAFLAVFLQDSIATFKNTTVADNRDGGLTLHGSTVTLSNSTVSGNRRSAGGAGLDNVDSAVTLVNSTVVGNATEDLGSKRGAGLSNLRSTVTLINTTVAGNSAYSEGGGLYNEDSQVMLQNALVAGNFSRSAGRASDIEGNAVEAGSVHNLLGDAATAGGLADGVNGNRVGRVAADLSDLGAVLDPAPGDNGGPTLTVALVAGSPALDAGDAAVCAAEPVAGFDQRGFARPVDGDHDGDPVCDIGALEAVTPPPERIVGDDFESGAP